ncbi:MAG TPA: carboxypeptidase-like regulatory domain-containing protein [Vicinamibacterales bacterium]|nr:carboxypeptidase-like regulatory domain-containing protein [Vicinamibacterales bacterium]
MFETGATGMRPLAGRQVELWIEYSPRPGRFESMRQDATTDEQGRYDVSGLPNSLVWIFAAPEPAARDLNGHTHLQPCAAARRVEQDTTFDVELVPADDPRPPTRVRPLTISGIVFETTPGGRVPVKGARIYAEKPLDFVATGAISDAEGRYRLCGLPEDQWSLFALAEGYQMWFGDPFPLIADRTLDIEVRR